MVAMVLEPFMYGMGPVYAEVVRGFEYRPLRKLVEIKPGQRELTLKIERAFDPYTAEIKQNLERGTAL